MRSGHQMDEELDKSGFEPQLMWLAGRVLANPATSQVAMKLRAGLREDRSAVGGEIDADSSSWRALIER